MVRYVLFDMDGTLVNSYPGIYASYESAFSRLELPFAGDEFVKKAIGAPLSWVFEHLAGLDRVRSEQAVRCYREYYADRGKLGAAAYDGVERTLRRLKEAGSRLGVATFKREAFALEILERLGLAEHFDVVCGENGQDCLTKAGLLLKCMERLGARADKTVLVGDSVFDMAGAKEAGIGFVAVTYGFGFRDPKERELLRGEMTADTPERIAELLLTAKEMPEF